MSRKPVKLKPGYSWTLTGDIRKLATGEVWRPGPADEVPPELVEEEDKSGADE